MKKRAKRIAAMLLALTMICQPSWGGTALAAEETAAAETTVEASADQQTGAGDQQSDADVQQVTEADQQNEAEEKQQAMEKQAEEQRLAQERVEKEKADREQQKEEQRAAESLKEDGIEIQARDSLSAPAPAETTDEFKGVYLEQIRRADGETGEIQAGDSMDVIFTWKNTTDDTVVLDNISGYWGYEETDDSLSREHYLYAEKSVASGESADITMSVEANAFEAPHSWSFESVSCNVYDRNDNYLGSSTYYSDKDNNTNWNGTAIPQELYFEYNGEADYRVINKGVIDVTAPVIDSITVEPEEISTYDEVTAVVDYTEEGSGITQVSLSFRSEMTGEEEYFDWYGNAGEGLTDGRLEIPLNGLRVLDDTYTLTYAYIADDAEYGMSYYPEEDGRLHSSDPDVAALDAVSYKVTKESAFDAVMIEDIRLDVNDKEELSAGDTFDLVVTLKNNMKEEVRVNGSAVWDGAGYKWYYSDRDATILPGMTGELRIRVETGKYCSAGTYMLDNIMYYVYDGNVDKIGEADYYADGSYSWWSAEIGEYISIPDQFGYEYTGNADYTITYAPDADASAPLVTGVYVSGEGIMEAEIGTYDKAKVLVNYSEEGSGIAYISIGYETEPDESGSYETEWFDLYEGESKEEQYVGTGTIELESRNFRELNDSYSLKHVNIRDFAGNETAYYMDEVTGMLVTDSGSEGGFAPSSYEVTYETELEYLLIEDIRLVDDNGSPIQKDQVTAGDSFNLAVTLDNNTAEDVKVSGAAYWRSGNESENTWTQNSVFIGSGNSGVLMIPVETNKYKSERTWYLESLNYSADTTGGKSVCYADYSTGTTEEYAAYYSYTDYTMDSESGEYLNIPVDGKYAYDGSGDYVIAHAPEADEEAPVIHKITVADRESTEAEIDTMTRMPLYITYTENGAGLSSFRAVFMNDDGAAEEVVLSYAGEEQYKGTEAELILYSSYLRQLGDTYRLTYVEVSDYAGNTRTYVLSEDGTQLIPSDGTEGIGSVSFTVAEESGRAIVLPVSVRLEDPEDPDFDRQNITAGDSFELVWKVDNRLKEDVTGTIYASWDSDENGYLSVQHAFSLAADEDEIRLPVETSRFASNGLCRLNNVTIQISSGSGERIGSLYMYYGDGRASWNDKGSDLTIVCEPYEGEGDYRITRENTPDTEPPQIESIQLLTTDVTAPGTVEFEIKAETGPAKMEDITMYLSDCNEENNNMIYVVSEDLYYSQQRQSYIFKASLDEDMASGTYHFDSINVYDEANHSNYYDNFNGMMVCGDLRFKDLTFEVTNTEGVIRDFDAPEVRHLSIDRSEPQAGDDVTFSLTAEDTSGISHLVLMYRNEQAGQNVYFTVPVENTGADTWEGRLDVDEYMQPGTYKLESVNVYDASPKKNSCFLETDGSGGIIDDCSFTVKGEDGYIYIPVNTGDYTQLDRAEEGQTVVFNESDYMEVSLNVIKTIQQKKLKAVFVCNGMDAYVIIDGADLTKDMVSYFSIYVSSRPSSSLYDTVLEFANGYDRMVQSLYLEAYSNTRIPYTVRWKINDRLIEKADETGSARISEYLNDTWTITEENIRFTEDGYLEKEFPEGYIGYKDYMVSTDTVKYFDYPLTVTATPSFTSDTITKGSSFEVDLTVTNPNKTPMTDVAVFTMINTEEAPECDWCTFESADGSVVPAENDAVISSIGAGETVRLTAKFNIPEDTDYERVPLLFVATSLTDDGQAIESCGDDEVRITLADKLVLQKGDINGDGIVNSGDLAFMLQLVNKRISVDELTQDQIQAGDVSASPGEAAGTINSGDLATLLQFINGRISSLD